MLNPANEIVPRFYSIFFGVSLLHMNDQIYSDTSASCSFRGNEGSSLDLMHVGDLRGRSSRGRSNLRSNISFTDQTAEIERLKLRPGGAVAIAWRQAASASHDSNDLQICEDGAAEASMAWEFTVLCMS